MSTPWLGDLEQRVSQAVAEINRLRLETKRLERELAKLRKAGGGADGAAAWERERTEVRSRVERLAQHLEELLGPGAADVLRSGEEPPAGG